MTLGNRRDWELLRKYVDLGSQEAFAELTRRYLGLVFGTALRELHNHMLAEDVTQAVFLILARKAHTFRPNVILPAWLFDTCKYVAGHARRAEARRRLRERRGAMEMRQQAETQERHRDYDDSGINDALSRLSPRDRQAVLLRYVSGYSYAETGAAFGISENTARMRVERAIEKMRRMLAKGGTALSAVAVAELVKSQAALSAPPVLIARIAEFAGANGTAAAGLAGVTAHTIAQGAMKSMTLANVKIAAIAVCGMVLMGGAAVYTTAASTSRPMASAGKMNKMPGRAALASAAASPAPATRGNRPARMLVSVSILDVPAATFDRLSKEAPATEEHEARLLDALQKIRTPDFGGAVRPCTDDTPRTDYYTVEEPNGPDPNGDPAHNVVTFPFETRIVAHANADGAISITLRLSRGGPVPGRSPEARPGPSTSRVVDAELVVPDGQTRLVRGVPTSADGAPAQYIFVKAMSITNSGATAFLIDPRARAMGRFMESQGAMSSEDYLRLYTIEELSAPTGALSEKDYDGLFALLQKPSREPWNVTKRVFAVFTDLGNLPPARREQLFQTAQRYFSEQPTDVNILCRGIVSHAMAQLGEKRMIPSLVHLLHYPSREVQRKAAEDLRALGYDPGVDGR